MTEKQFYSALRKLFRAYGGVDSEGDLRIEATIVDRRTHERMHFAPLPYGPDVRPTDETFNLWEERFCIATMNLSMAQGQIDMIRRQLPYEDWRAKLK